MSFEDRKFTVAEVKMKLLCLLLACAGEAHFSHKTLDLKI